MVNRFGSYFYGSILGVFGLAILTPRAGAAGALLRPDRRAWPRWPRWRNLTPVHFLWYNVVGAVVVFAVGLLITAVLGSSRRE